MASSDGVVFGIINIIAASAPDRSAGNFGTVFVDQSYWQSSVAAKPRAGVLGFLAGGLVWFAIPFCFATAMGLGYLSLGFLEGRPILSDQEVSKGLVPPAVAQRLFGYSGGLMIVIMLLMSVISTASAEIMAVVSIVIYDVYAVHLKPYRAFSDANSCILCGKAKGRLANPMDRCACESMTFCAECRMDNQLRAASKRAVKPGFTCRIHGPYRHYKEYLSGLKDWWIVYVTLAIIPLTLVLNFVQYRSRLPARLPRTRTAQVSLGWLYLFMGILIGSAVAPICLCMLWSRLTGPAMICGAVGGSVAGLASWLAAAGVAAAGDEASFADSTGSNRAMLVGNLVSIFTGLLVTLAVTMATNRSMDADAAAEVWEVTRDIDNPLLPWAEVYAKEMNLVGAHCLDNRPSLEATAEAFRGAKLTANIGALGLTALLILLWPASMMSMKTMDLGGFTAWIAITDVWAIAAGLFIIVVPLINEACGLRDALRRKKQVATELNRCPWFQVSLVPGVSGSRCPGVPGSSVPGSRCPWFQVSLVPGVPGSRCPGSRCPWFQVSLFQVSWFQVSLVPGVPGSRCPWFPWFQVSLVPGVPGSRCPWFQVPWFQSRQHCIHEVLRRFFHIGRRNLFLSFAAAFFFDSVQLYRGHPHKPDVLLSDGRLSQGGVLPLLLHQSRPVGGGWGEADEAVDPLVALERVAVVQAEVHSAAQVFPTIQSPLSGVEVLPDVAVHRLQQAVQELDVRLCCFAGFRFATSDRGFRRVTSSSGILTSCSLRSTFFSYSFIDSPGSLSLGLELSLERIAGLENLQVLGVVRNNDVSEERRVGIGAILSVGYLQRAMAKVVACGDIRGRLHKVLPFRCVQTVVQLLVELVVQQEPGQAVHQIESHREAVVLPARKQQIVISGGRLARVDINGALGNAFYNPGELVVINTFTPYAVTPIGLLVFKMPIAQLLLLAEQPLTWQQAGVVILSGLYKRVHRQFNVALLVSLGSGSILVKEVLHLLLYHCQVIWMLCVRILEKSIVWTRSSMGAKTSSASSHSLPVSSSRSSIRPERVIPSEKSRPAGRADLEAAPTESMLGRRDPGGSTDMERCGVGGTALEGPVGDVASTDADRIGRLGLEKLASLMLLSSSSPSSCGCHSPGPTLAHFRRLSDAIEEGVCSLTMADRLAYLQLVDEVRLASVVWRPRKLIKSKTFPAAMLSRCWQHLRPHHRLVPVAMASVAWQQPAHQRSFCSAPTAQASVIFDAGLPRFRLPLPGRNGVPCQFTLKPLTDTVGDLVACVRKEDRGLEMVAFYTKDGFRVASSDPIESLLRSDGFQVQLNEQRYQVAVPAALADSDQIQPQQLDDVRNSIAQLYTGLGVRDFQEAKERQLSDRLAELRQQIQPLEEVRLQLANKASQQTRVLTWLGLSFMGLQFGFLARLTWWEYSWDIMEPVIYFVGYGTLMVAYAYYVITKQEYTFPQVWDREYLKKFYSDAEKRKFDVEQYNMLREQISQLETEARRLKDPLILSPTRQKSAC
uniref:MCU domain-containing protein n=3 Tax=Macrostomum lignano TaxID=282301 RepID=A0A1I8GDX2_9PLAT